jgi:hypothetical protein
MRNPHVPPGFWRGVNLNQNAIYLECFHRRVAACDPAGPAGPAPQADGKHPKHLAVLNAVAQRAGWGTPAAVNGQKVFRGLAQTMGFGSYVAACAEVSVSADGELTVHRIVAATDCGHAVNPQQIEAQVEGSFAYGLSAALLRRMHGQGRPHRAGQLHTYPVLLMAHMPKVETIVMPSGGFWGGVGEPTIAVAAPAVLNAIFAATGRRIRDLPLKNQNLKRMNTTRRQALYTGAALAGWVTLRPAVAQTDELAAAGAPVHRRRARAERPGPPGHCAAGGQRQHGAHGRVGRFTHDGGRPCDGHRGLQRTQPAARSDQGYAGPARGQGPGGHTHPPGHIAKAGGRGAPV